MEVKSIEKREKSTAAITVEVSPEEFEKAIDEVYKKNKNSITIPGFRKGKAPRRIIERMYGDAIFYEEAINNIIPDAYSFAVKEKELKVAAYPSVEDADVSDDKTLTLKIVASLYPEVELGQYKGIEAPRKEVKVDPEEVDIRIEALRNRNSRIVTCEREAKFGDIVVIDYEGFVDGVAFEGGKGENHSLEIGSNSFIPGFESQCIGLKAGEEKDINVTFPEIYHAEHLQGKQAVFKIKVHEVKEKLLPELDDEFVKDVSEYDTLEELKKSIYDEISQSKSEAVKNDFLDKILAQVVENAKVELPDAMIDERTQQMIQDYAGRLRNQGMDLNSYLDLFQMDPAHFESTTRNTAEKQLKSELALRKIAEIENLQVTEEDKQEEYERLAKAYGVDAESIKTFFDEEVFNDSMLLTKAADFLIENAVALPEPEEEAEEAEDIVEEKSEDKAAEADNTENSEKTEE
jgi:trigger factor